eukprot:775553-Rhodomonas_salina.1
MERGCGGRTDRERKMDSGRGPGAVRGPGSAGSQKGRCRFCCHSAVPPPAARPPMTEAGTTERIGARTYPLPSHSRHSTAGWH